MSHYTEVRNTTINDLSILMKALKELGYETKKNQSITGDQGKRQVDLATKIGLKYCVGFQKNKDGTYSVVADWRCVGVSSREFISELKQIYNTEKVICEAKSRGYSLIQQKVVTGGIRLVLRKIA